MKFADHKVWPDRRFAIGREEESGRYYLAIAVSNARVDYEEYYEIDLAIFETFSKDSAAAASFAERCRRRELDHLLILPPGTDRGV